MTTSIRSGDIPEGPKGWPPRRTLPASITAGDARPSDLRAFVDRAGRPVTGILDEVSMRSGIGPMVALGVLAGAAMAIATLLALGVIH